MVSQIKLGNFTVDVILKDIRNIHLSVHPPTGRVRISAPKRMHMDSIRGFAVSKLHWIKQQQAKLRGQERETPREYVERESHYLWGERYLLAIIENQGPPSIELKHNRMFLQVRPGTDTERRQALVEEWYRGQIKAVVPELIAKWGPVLGVSVRRVFIQRMKTRWGSCNTQAGTIRLNTELAKKPKECLEYIVVHEMIHLLEPRHNSRFIHLLDQHLPMWQYRRQALNRLPIRREEWGY